MARGLTDRLTPDQLETLTKRVQSAGGQRLSTKCEGYLAPFTIQHGSDTRVTQLRTCACFTEKVRFEVPYADTDPTDPKDTLGPVDGKGSFIACANCDGLNLHPSFQEGAA